MPTEKLQVSYRRTLANFDEDVIVTTMHFQSDTGGLLTENIRLQVEQAWGTWWDFYGDISGPQNSLHEFRWYDQQVWPTRSPLLRVNDTVDIPGSGLGNVLPPQCACSMTLQTVDRRRWGRFYMPAPTSNYLSATTGRLITTHVDTIRDQLGILLQACKGQGAVPVTWSPRGGSRPPTFGAGSTALVTGYRVDDIIDTIRRRRFQDKPYRATGVIS